MNIEELKERLADNRYVAVLTWLHVAAAALAAAVKVEA